jgi:serine/threonine protein kinase
MEKIFLRTINSGSFGHILEDDKQNIYKLTLLGDHDYIHRNNIIEACIFNKQSFPSKLKNIPEQNVFLYIMHQFYSFYDVDNECKKMLTLYKCDENSYLFIIKMKKYSMSLGKFVYNNSFIENKLYFDKIAKQILIGLYNLHVNNFIHGDLKSANIMINRNIDGPFKAFSGEDVFLIDFGGIKTIDTVFYTKSCTLTYRSIEELGFELNYKNNIKQKNYYFKPSFKNDIWSLGIIFSEILLKNNFMQRYYTKKEKLYRKNNIKNDDFEEYIEKSIYEKFSNKNINILHYANKYMVYNIDSKYINVINKMLSIDSKNGYNNINEIYYDLFNKNIEDDHKNINIIKNINMINNDDNMINNDDNMIKNDDNMINNKINYDYSINISEDNLKKLLEIRNENYNWILNFFINDDILILLPLMINIADRFFIFILENNYKEKLPKIEHINKLLLIGCLILSMVVKYVDIAKIKEFYTFFNININYQNFKTYLQYAIVLIINKLNFDIYRPYHDDKLTEEIMSNDDLYLQYKHKLHKKISLLILSNKLNLTPNDYFE